MKSSKPRTRKFSSTIMTVFIIFSALAVINITSINVSASYDETIYWPDGYTIPNGVTKTYPTDGNSSTLIRMYFEDTGGDLTIEDGGTLVLNDNVTFQIECPEAGDFGINIESGGKFIINSPLWTTEIISNPADPDETYPFTNSGTIDFLGATVQRVYGDPSAKTTTGGIRNEPGSVCNLTNCNIQDADTHSIFVDNSNLTIKGSNTRICPWGASNNNGTGISIKGNSNVSIEQITINNTQEYGIKCVDAENVTIQNGATIKKIGSVGIYINNSDVTIKDSYINNNSGDGLEIVQGSVSTIDNNEIEWNDGYGIKVDNSTPIIKDNSIIGYNDKGGVYIKDVTNISAIIENNNVSYNMESGIYCKDSKITIANNTISTNGQGLIWWDSMESGTNNTNWTADGLWHPVSNKNSSAPAWNLSHDGFWSYWYGNDTTGNYSTNGTRNYGNLTSELIDLTNYSSASLTFWSWNETDGTSDVRKLIINNSVTEWNTTLSEDDNNSWVKQTFDLTSFVGSKINITFYFDTVDGNNNSFQGWYIDEVEVIASYPAAEGNGIYLEGELQSLIINNTINENNHNGIYCYGNAIESVKDCVLSGNRQTGFYIKNADRINAWDEPEYIAGTDLGYYIWVDDDDWHIRWSGDGSSHTFIGNITFENLTNNINATAINLDVTDSYNINNSYINFNATESSSDEGFDISFNGDYVNFELWVDGIQNNSLITIGKVKGIPSSAEFKLSQPLEINNCEILESDCGIVTTMDPYVDGYSQTLIRNNIISNMDDKGIWGIGGNHIYVNNTISDCLIGIRSSGTENTYYLKNNITSCIIGLYLRQQTNMGVGTFVGYIENNTIDLGLPPSGTTGIWAKTFRFVAKNNDIRACSGFGSDELPPCYYENNTIEYYSYGISIGDACGVSPYPPINNIFTITQNEFMGTSKTYGHAIWNSKMPIKCNVNNNTINNSGSGIFAVKLAGNISDNVITNVTWGIYIKHANEQYALDHLYIKNNHLSELWGYSSSASPGYGMKIYLSDTCTVSNNTIDKVTISPPSYDNFIGGIVSESSSITINKNNIKNITEKGIYVITNNNSLFMNNTLYKNDYGIYLESTTNTTIYHNNFINNTNQAYDNGTGNIWNDSYPSGGNFWSDYNGTDTKYGSNQNYTGADGIGDTPYTDILGGSSKDNYPLMGPITDGRFMKPPFRIDSNSDFTTKSWIAPTGNGSTNNPWSIKNCYVNGSGEGYCIYIGNVTDYFKINNCKLYDVTGNSGTYYWNTGLALYNATNGLLEDNFMLSGDNGIYLHDSGNNTIEDNYASSNTEFGIYLHDSDNNTIEDNSASSNTEFGIYLYDSNNNTIDDNTANSNGGTGIMCETSDNNTITDNTANSNTETGIQIDYSDYNDVKRNTANSQEIGININDAVNNLFDDNTVSSNDYGIFCEASASTTITNNTVSLNNDYGIFVDISENISIHHNKIINNTNQAYDGGSNNDNSWDNGYPSGGNYWSDYNGTDVYGGSGQNLSGSDGIGDTNYTNIDVGSSVDNYPIMSANMDTYIYWAKSFGGSNEDTPRDTQQTADGGYIVAGYTRSFGASNYDAWVIKFYANSTIEWQKRYGGYSDERAMTIQQTDDDGDGEQDDGYIVGGYTHSFGGSCEYWIFKLYSDGTIDWQNRYGYAYNWDANYAIRQTDDDDDGKQDDGYIVAGYTWYPTAGLQDYWIIKLYPNGTIDWQKRYGGAGEDIPYSIEQTDDDNDGRRDDGYIIAGWTKSGVSQYAYWILKIANNGSIEWQKRYGGSGIDRARSIHQTNDGGYIVAGSSQSYTEGNYDIWVLKLYSNGSIEWQKHYGNTSSDRTWSIEQTDDNGYIIGGWTNSYGKGASDAWVIKLHPNGTINWQMAYGGTGNDRIFSIKQTTDKGYIIAGDTTSPFSAIGSRDVWVLKIGPNGGVTFDYDESGANVTITNTTAQDSNCTAIDTSATIGDISYIGITTTANTVDTNCTVKVQATYNYGWC